MKHISIIVLLSLPIASLADQAVPLPDDEWQPLTLEQAESVCVFEKPQRPYMDHKMHDTTDKKTKQCIEKTRKYGLIGQNFLGLTGHYREEKAVRQRELELERQANKQQSIETTSEPAMPKATTPPTTPMTTTRGGAKTDSQRLADLEKRLEQLEKENARLRKQFEEIKE
jgi:hypothetical protein